MGNIINGIDFNFGEKLPLPSFIDDFRNGYITSSECINMLYEHCEIDYNKFPINPYIFSKHLGFDIFYKESTGEIDEVVSICCDDRSYGRLRSKRYIILPFNSSIEVEHFLLSLELARFILFGNNENYYYERIYSEPVLNGNSLYKKKLCDEKKEYIFAGEMLIPFVCLLNYAKNADKSISDEDLLEELSVAFKLPKEAIVSRVRGL